jgi:hypothetical protein
VSRLGVYWNWFKLDPWFAPRFYLRDFWHPRSPLSSTSLVHRAFFSSSFPTDRVRDFEQYMPEYESLAWPLGMIFPFVNIRRVLMNIVGWRYGQQRLLIVAGEKDTLMGVSFMRQMATKYRRSVVTPVQGLLPKDGKEIDPDKTNDLNTRQDGNGSTNGVRFEVIKRSGHHLQNDLQWEECANQILCFLDQL